MVWILGNFKCRTSLVGHTGVVFCVSVSPDGSLAASSGKGDTATLWDATTASTSTPWTPVDPSAHRQPEDLLARGRHGHLHQGLGPGGQGRAR